MKKCENKDCIAILEYQNGCRKYGDISECNIYNRLYPEHKPKDLQDLLNRYVSSQGVKKEDWIILLIEIVRRIQELEK